MHEVGVRVKQVLFYTFCPRNLAFTLKIYLNSTHCIHEIFLAL